MQLSHRPTPTLLLTCLLPLLHIPHARAYSVATLENFWYRWTNSCELGCHINTWNGQNCSTANTCGAEDGCLRLSDQCLCVTPEWVTAVFRCIGRDCGPDAVHDAATLSLTGCQQHGVDNVYSRQQLIDIGLVANSTNSTTAATFAQTASPGQPTSSTSGSPASETSDVPVHPANTNTGDGGLSTTSQIAIGVVVPVSIALLGWLGKIAVTVRKRRRKQKEKITLLAGLVSDKENSVPLLNEDASQATSGVPLSFSGALPVADANSASQSRAPSFSSGNGSALTPSGSPSTPTTSS